MELNKIYQGNVLEVLKTFPDECIDCVITSPPYWSLRDYGEQTKTIWDGEANCKHEWAKHVKKPSGGKGSKSAKMGANKNDFANMRDHNIVSNFCTKCGAWRGQLGLEPTLDLYIKHMLQITKELFRVLKKTGTLWWNHGDSYKSDGGPSRHWGYSDPKYPQGRKIDYLEPSSLPQGNIQAKSLLLQNFRLATLMVDEQAWILRNICIWHKPNQMPQSAKDRFTNDFEPVFFFVKNKKYYFEPQFEPYSDTTIPRMLRGVIDKNKWVGGPDGQTKHTMSQPRKNITKEFTEIMAGAGTSFIGHSGYKKADGSLMINPRGRNKRTVWTIPTKPFSEAHFAVFPPDLIETPIRAGCPEFICKKCGKAREKIFEKKEGMKYTEEGNPEGVNRSKMKWNDSHPTRNPRFWSNPKVVGYTDCGCGVDFEAGVVLDPFMGSGTTGLVARNLGRNFVGIELNKEYIDIAEKRLAQQILI